MYCVFIKKILKLESRHKKINFASLEPTDVDKTMPVLSFGTYKKSKRKIEDYTPMYFKSVICGPENAFFIDSNYLLY